MSDTIWMSPKEIALFLAHARGKINGAAFPESGPLNGNHVGPNNFIPYQAFEKGREGAASGDPRTEEKPTWP
jgi:hypothetical protein